MFFNLFRKNGVPQTGFIDALPKPTDYLQGVLPLEVNVRMADWEMYLPQGEEQGITFTFDTMSCVTFSAINTVIMQLNFLIDQDRLSTQAIDFLKNNGYFNENGKLDISKRFIAILSGTTKNGNTFSNVAWAIRNFGLIPTKMLPFGGQNFEQYHNPALINQSMLDMGKQWKKYFDVYFEFSEDTFGQLQHTPLQVSIPRSNPHHAVARPNLEYIFDSYDPFYKRRSDISYAFKLLLVPQTVTPLVLKRGSKGPEVKALQEKMKQHIPGVTADGQFGVKTEKALKWLQGALNLRPDGIYGAITKEKLENESFLPIINFREPTDKIAGVNHIAIRLLQRARTALKFPMVVTSGLRNPEHNSDVGGVENSSHLTGLALDVFAYPERQRLIIAELKKFGVTRFGKYFDHLHFDIDLSKEDAEW